MGFSSRVNICLNLAGKFYTLTTGANEFRWDKMKDRLKTVLASFEVVDRFPTA